MIFGPDTDAPLEPPPETLDEVRPIRLQTVLGGTPQSQQWNAFIARYHYLGYKTLVGAQMRYIVHDRHGRLLALLGFSTAARKLAPRDRFILDADTAGEESPQGHRQRPFPHPALDTHPQPRLAHLVRRVPTVDCGLDRALSHRAPVDRNVRGDAALHWRPYKASGWTHVGITQGRGRYDRHKKYDKPKKTIWLRPSQRLETDAQPLTPTQVGCPYTPFAMHAPKR